METYRNKTESETELDQIYFNLKLLNELEHLRKVSNNSMCPGAVHNFLAVFDTHLLHVKILTVIYLTSTF